MKAAILKEPRKVVLEEIPVPMPGPDEALLKVKACGICGSDIRYFQGKNPWAKQTLGEDLPNPPNIILGHELSGELVEDGKRVAVLSFKACGKCYYCLEGRENLCAFMKHLGHGAGWGKRDYCPGGMAEYCNVWKDKLYPLPEEISFEEATFLDPLAVAIHAVNQVRQSRTSQNPLKDTIAIFGSGPLGLLILQVAKVFGCPSVTCIDIWDKPLKVARTLGADEIINVEKNPQRIMNLTDNGGLNLIFDTAGTEKTILQALRILKRGGTLALMAILPDYLDINSKLITGERQIMSLAGHRYEDFASALSLLKDKKIKVSPIITHRFPLEQIQKAFQVAQNKRKHQALKVIILP